MRPLKNQPLLISQLSVAVNFGSLVNSWVEAPTGRIKGAGATEISRAPAKVKSILTVAPSSVPLPLKDRYLEIPRIYTFFIL